MASVWNDALTGYQTYIESGVEDESRNVGETSVIATHKQELERGLLCARIIRNAVAGSPEGQVACFKVVPLAISALWKTTAFALEGEENVQVLTRTLVQLLSNLITQNDDLKECFWLETLLITGEEPSLGKSRGVADLFVRLLQSSDAMTSTSAQVLLLNCTLESDSRMRGIVTSTSGCKIIRSMLDTVALLLDEDEKDEETEERQQVLQSSDSAIDLTFAPGEQDLLQRRKRFESLGVLYAFFTSLFDHHLFGQLFINLAPVDSGVDGVVPSVITSSQITLLKLLDSYLHFGATTYRDDILHNPQSIDDLTQLLVTFEKLSSWAEKVMAAAFKAQAEAEVDSRLVQVHIGLILLLQCLITLGLTTEREGRRNHPIGNVAEKILLDMRTTSFVPSVISLLHTLAEFAPPVSPFKPATPQISSVSAPRGHTLTSTGIAATASADAIRKGPSLDNLKRDLVNIVGILSYERCPGDKEQVRAVQDKVRECGGLFDVLNMTQLDEHNPYIRERAMFTLRNLLRGNQTSQDLIAQLKPLPSNPE
ncbi:hypothetical protein CBS101457_000714 [Exobasidium rhododendri]|nr:hypothetical protein CBS101457_000714 [Exobasidium rhododendri]